MSRFPGRGRIVRLTLGLVALAVPLVGASSVQAAMGTSPTFLPQNRPALVSVTDQGGTGLVNFCFQTSGGQAVVPEPPPGPGTYQPNDFALGGYDDGNVQFAATVSQLNNSCVQATFALGEIGEYSYGTVNDSAVVAIIAGNPVGNLEDSAPLIGSSSNNGTRGFTTGLDLVNVLSPGSNRLAFVFDQDVRTDNLTPDCPGPNCVTNDFLFYDGGGNLRGNGFPANQPRMISVSDNVIVIQYDNPPDPVADARIGYVRDHAVAFDNVASVYNFIRADTPGLHSTRTSIGSAAVAGQPGAGNTAKIEPTGAALVNNGNSNQVNFTFETDVAFPGPNPACFVAVTSNNNQLSGDAVSISGNTVTVTFNGMQEITEMIVRAGVRAPDPGAPAQPSLPDNCVQSTTGAVGNTMAGLPVGGNVGAVATGYTVGPEALAGITTSGGDVRVPVDQRVDPSTIITAGAVLLDDQGNPIGGAPSSASVTGNGSPNDPHAITYTYDPVAVAAASGMQLQGTPWIIPTLFTFPAGGGCVDAFCAQHGVMQTFALP